MLQEMIVNLIHVPSNYLSLFTVFSQSLQHRALRNMKRVTTPNSSTNIQKSSCTLHTLIQTRPHYLPVSKELINTGLREKGCIGKNEIGKHDTCQCSPMICYLLFLLQGDVLVTVQSKQPIHSSYYSHHYECIVTARVVPLGTQEDLQERKASKAVMSFRQDPSSSVQAEP